MRMTRVYLAAPIFKPEQLEVVKFIKESLECFPDFEVFSPFHNSQAIFRGRKPADCAPVERSRVIADNVRGLDWCDYLFAWVGGMGGFTDPGVVWEMGYVGARSKTPAAFGQLPGYPFTIAYIDDMDERADMNLMLSATVDAVVAGRKGFDRFCGLICDHDPNLIAAVFQPDLVVNKEPVV